MQGDNTLGNAIPERADETRAHIDKAHMSLDEIRMGCRRAFALKLKRPARAASWTLSLSLSPSQSLSFLPSLPRCLPPSLPLSFPSSLAPSLLPSLPPSPFF
eukprot:3934515-Pleurochrysis_carterae.AAC.3